jgi:hypothetical protein
MIYRDAFWAPRDIASPQLDQVAQDEAQIARLTDGPAFAVGPTARAELRSKP